jgi:hypothetical protein
MQAKTSRGRKRTRRNLGVPNEKNQKKVGVLGREYLPRLQVQRRIIGLLSIHIIRRCNKV